MPLFDVATSRFRLSHLGLRFAGSAAFAMSTLFSAMKPVMLTRFIEQAGYSEGMAGLTVAMPFVGIALASFVQHRRGFDLPYRQLVFVYGGLLIATELACGYLFQFSPAVLALQFLAGLCVGVLMGATTRYIANTDNPDSLFGFVDMVGVLIMSFMVAGFGIAVQRLGLQGGYWFACLLALAYVSVMALAPVAQTGGVSVAAGLPPLAVRPLASLAMGVIFVTASGLGFTFMFSIGIDLGLSYEDAGSKIGLLLFVSAFACQVGGWASAYFGPTWPLAFGFVACAIGWYLVIHASSLTVFFVGLVPAIFALQFCFPILLALSGSMDGHGRWAAVAAPIQTSGFAWAAIVAGLLVSRWNLSALAYGTALGMALCLLLLVLVRRLRDLS